MVKIILEGWTAGFEKASLMKLQMEKLGMSLNESQSIVDALLNDQIAVLETKDAGLAKEFLKKAEEIGVDCRSGLLSLIEQTGDWKSAICFLERDDAHDLRAYLRMTFVLLDFIVDGQYTEDEADTVAAKIKYFFDRANLKYSENPEFLFFSGKMICIAEWYFGIDDIDQAISMIKKAKDSDPDNILYEWGYYSTIDQRPEINTAIKLKLSHKLMNTRLAIEDLKGLGMLGAYLFEMLEYTNEELQRVK